MPEKQLPNSVFGFEKPEDSLGFLLWQTTITWQRLIKKALAPHKVTHPQFVLLALLQWLGEQALEASQGTLIRFSKLDKMTVSTALRHLEKQGYVTRQEDKTDTRAKQAILTSKGKALISRLVPLVEAIDAHFFKDLSPQDSKVFCRGFHHLADQETFPKDPNTSLKKK